MFLEKSDSPCFSNGQVTGWQRPPQLDLPCPKSAQRNNAGTVTLASKGPRNMPKILLTASRSAETFICSGPENN
ncbi:hypothetical protein HYPSUDRAFT_39523 [Hypholoma sublateritium FD-334 SS-4]|uniref:Uncharacterized protein n=1 Tax=Hypholoma sublateritium (strain FD-334 SS-4) TaxID=945553 RepID=A0A0D2L931_HYPSF|nr:hypothetical protein HYPSUDRAFT_39523 [Hypholoma sublateritium FD-334 SS-4]